MDMFITVLLVLNTDRGSGNFGGGGNVLGPRRGGGDLFPTLKVMKFVSCLTIRHYL